MQRKGQGEQELEDLSLPLSALFQEVSVGNEMSYVCSVCGINFDDDPTDSQWIGCDRCNR